ncbi:RNA polymerase sigma factor RpoD/SigA [Treponema primitia]|uniref:sigma-70 family RNA polymerase sigma factor n=1 Tax=Treponema primitia TaxID=88058 RepID=UPI0039816BE6
MDKNLQNYYDQIKKIPLLNFEEELALSERIQQGDATARKSLIEANLRLVIKIAHSYMTADMPFMDIIQEGNLGLMHAAEKYDYRKRVRFSTYASWWIRQYIVRSLSTKRRDIRLPLRKEQTLRMIQRSYHTLSQTLMHKPSNKEIAADIGVSEKEVNFILQITNGFISLDMDTGKDESISMADLHEDYTYSPERDFFKKSSHAVAIHFLDRLKDREKRILMYRYQFNGNEHTLKKIGDKMGLSAETVRQIEIKALKKMQGSADEFRKCLYVEAM